MLLISYNYEIKYKMPTQSPQPYKKATLSTFYSPAYV